MAVDIKLLSARLVAGERAALAQALSYAEQFDAHYLELRRCIGDAVRGQVVLGMTGPPGAGKSSLVNALAKEWRRRDLRVAVIAVDPSSPISGGALLGDRVRMSAALDDEGVFVRSLSSAGSVGGLAPAAVRLIDLFDAAGFDRIMIETVGAGQSEIDIALVADLKAVVSAPGLGDGIQAIKSGLLEIADFMVVNKSDLPGADATAEQLRNAVSLRNHTGDAVPVIATSTIDGSGIVALTDAFEEKVQELAGGDPHDRLRRRAIYLIEQIAAGLLRDHLRGRQPSAAAEQIIGRLADGDIDPRDAAMQVLHDAFG